MTVVTNEPAAELRGATKRFGEVYALDGVDLAVRQGETLAILGPNGAGKTTAVSLMLGMRRPTAGRALLWGRDPRELGSRARIGVMLQESGLPETLKVREALELFRRLYARPLTVAAALDAAGLPEKTDARVGSLSGGQRQRLYFALALVGDPSLLFLDEPSAGLDVESRRAFWARIGEMARGGMTVVLTTHYIEEADALADRIIVIHRGRIVAEGPPAEIKARAGGKMVRFRAPGVDAAYLAGLPGVGRFTLADDAAELYTIEPEAAVHRLFIDGLPVRDLEVRGAALEEAFLSLTSD